MHMDELDEHVVAIESDAGVFAPQGFGFSGNKGARRIIEDIHELLIPIKANQITDWGRAPDVAILNDEGIPASWPWTYKDFVEAMKEPKLENFSFKS